ncbi:hypothetical protein COCVIDRAFT_97056, partial [Bipolaris victoriae FI3]
TPSNGTRRPYETSPRSPARYAHQGSLPGFFTKREARAAAAPRWTAAPRLIRTQTIDSWLLLLLRTTYTSSTLERLSMSGAFELRRIVGLHDDNCGKYRQPHVATQNLDNGASRCRRYQPVSLPLYGRCPSSVCRRFISQGVRWSILTSAYVSC